MTPRASTDALDNPPRKVLSREQIETKQRKAVDFLRRVVGDDLVPYTDLTGDELADEIEAMSLEEYAEKKRITLANPDRQIIEHALTQLPPQATREERARAVAKTRAALIALAPDAGEAEEIEAAREAVAPVAEECQRRLRIERLGSYNWMYLPFPHLDKDKAEADRIARHLLEELPVSLSEYQVQTRIKEVLKPLARKIEARNRRRKLVEDGQRRVSTILRELYRDEVISREDLLDSKLRNDLEKAVADELREQLRGSETTEEVEEIVADVVAEELDLEPADEDGDEEDY
ncbi:MAG: hypothetical protein ACREA0_13540 [bacterium]